MITTYLSLYLFFVIGVALLIGLVILRSKLSSLRLIVILITVFVLLPSIAGYFYIAYFDSLPEVVVPDLTGMKFENAKEKLDAIDLQARMAGSVYEMKYPEGCVVSQRPEAGRRVKVGRMVNLIVSSGVRKVVVPNLLGRPVTQADAVLSAVGLQLGEVRQENNPDVSEGAIIAQEPLPGEETGTGQVVDLLVSTTAEVAAPLATPEAGASDEEEEKSEGGFKLW